MIIKNKGFKKTNLNRFELLGAGETALSKAFAYILGKERSVCFDFLKTIGIKVKNTESNFENIEIIIEPKSKEGRTDIEIKSEDFHVIIECKVGKNPIKDQRNKYNSRFDNNKQQALCFITQEFDFVRDKKSTIKVYYKNWLDIISLVEKHQKQSIELKEFNRFAHKGFKMRNQKEVLIFIKIF